MIPKCGRMWGFRVWAFVAKSLDLFWGLRADLRPGWEVLGVSGGAWMLLSQKESFVTAQVAHLGGHELLVGGGGRAEARLSLQGYCRGDSDGGVDERTQTRRLCHLPSKTNSVSVPSPGCRTQQVLLGYYY